MFLVLLNCTQVLGFALSAPTGVMFMVAGLGGLSALIAQAGSWAPPEPNRQSRVTNEGFKIPRGFLRYVPSIFEECWGRREVAQFVLRILVTITK